METKNSTNAYVRKSILICILLMTAVAPTFSQTNSFLIVPIPTFNLEVVFTVLGVVALALFMFIAFIRQRNKENKEMRDTRHERRRPQVNQGSHTQRKHSNMGHFKY